MGKKKEKAPHWGLWDPESHLHIVVAAFSASKRTIPAQEKNPSSVKKIGFFSSTALREPSKDLEDHDKRYSYQQFNFI